MHTAYMYSITTYVKKMKIKDIYMHKKDLRTCNVHVRFITRNIKYK